MGFMLSLVILLGLLYLFNYIFFSGGDSKTKFIVGVTLVGTVLLMLTKSILTTVILLTLIVFFGTGKKITQ